MPEESLKDEMAEALRGDIERAREKRVAPPPPSPQPEPQPEPKRSLLGRLRGR